MGNVIPTVITFVLTLLSAIRSFQLPSFQFCPRNVGPAEISDREVLSLLVSLVFASVFGEEEAVVPSFVVVVVVFVQVVAPSVGDVELLGKSLQVEVSARKRIHAEGVEDGWKRDAFGRDSV